MLLDWGDYVVHEFIQLSVDKKRVVAQVKAEAIVEQTYSYIDLIQTLNSIGAGEYLINEEDAELFLTSINESAIYNVPFSMDVYVVIAEQLNATIEIDIREDEMSATMTVTGAYGGKGINGKMILALLSTNQICKGIQKSTLQELLPWSKTLQPGESFSVEIAEGRLPIDGSDAQLIPLVENIHERILCPQLEEGSGDKVDMRDLGDTITIAKGDPVMKRIPETKGMDGFTITGTELAAADGKKVILKPGKGTMLSPNNSNLLVASINGTPFIQNDSAEVDEVLFLDKVDIGSGHINYIGSVVVFGDVTYGMKVEATGSILVCGFIESAHVHAGGDIISRQGIIGHVVDNDEEMTCYVDAKGSIKSRFSQYVELKSGGDIALSLHAINCNIYCGGDLRVVDEFEKSGTLCGGNIEVKGAITLVDLGAVACIPTSIKAFSDYSEYKKTLVSYQRSYYEQMQDVMGDDTNFMDVESYTEAGTISDPLSLAQKRLEEQQNKLKQLLGQKVITVKNRVYPMVNVSFADTRIMTKREHSPSRIMFDGHDISIDPLLN